MRFNARIHIAVIGAVFAMPLAASFCPAVAAVYSSERALSADEIRDFIANPAALLEKYPDGGALMIARVRDLLASDPSTLNPITGLLPNTNYNQATAIGTALGQVALMAVKSDQAYAGAIQEALVKSQLSPGGPNASGQSLVDPRPGSAQPKIGNAVTTKDQVDGATERGTASLTAGSVIYEDEVVRTGVTGKAELLFNDHTNMTLAPVTEIKLDKFAYDPNSKTGNVLVVATLGAFRFITGVQRHEDYQLKTPYATMGVRGTQFLALLSPDDLKVQLFNGVVIVTTISNKVATLDIPGTILVVDSYGNVQTLPPTPQPIVEFADLGPPVTDLQFADARNAFDAVTGDVGIGAGALGGGVSGGGVGLAGLGSANSFVPNGASDSVSAH